MRFLSLNFISKPTYCPFKLTRSHQNTPNYKPEKEKKALYCNVKQSKEGFFWI